MATNKYVNTTLAAGSKVLAGAGFPGPVMVLLGTYEKTAADTDTSVLRLGKVPRTAIPLYHSARLNNDALAGATDIDVGLYKSLAGGGDVVDKDILTDGIDIAAGNALASPVAAFQAVALEKFGLNLGELVDLASGTTSYDQEYDLAITGNTFGVALGTISWSLAFLLPQA